MGSTDREDLEGGTGEDTVVFIHPLSAPPPQDQNGLVVVVPAFDDLHRQTPEGRMRTREGSSGHTSLQGADQVLQAMLNRAVA
uniref:hypothetical protein n=1 Tax=Actinoplanes sp. CA-151224 TaxID=3239904 RepID=UPI003F494C49